MKNKDLKDFIYRNVYQNASTGYVLTPSELAFEMMQTLPKSVFKSESTTFLDPICKSGTFLFEIVEELYNEGHSVKNIESRVYTIDDNSHSLNVANSYIKKILNKLSGSFKIDYKSDFAEKYYNRLILSISKGKYKTFDDFLSTIMVDKDNNVLMKELQKNISEFIEQYEKVSKLESKLFGEVFTPRKLIDEILDTLPEDVWKNKNLKWLDPAVGIGNFPAAILDRLMIGLSDEFKDELERRKHILEEMLYFCDISIKNLFLLYKLFDCNNEFKLNVYRGSFLTDDFDKHMKEVWKLEGFDIVVGNPPYQGDNKGNGSNLYEKFHTKSINLLIKDGYLCLITPLNWLSPNGNLESEFTKFNLMFININECAKHFTGVGSEFSYYLIKKCDHYTSTEIITIDSKFSFSLRYFSFLPKYISIESLSIHEKFFNNSLECLNVERDQSHTQYSKKMIGNISSEMSDKFCHKMYNTSSKNGIKYSTIKHPLTNTTKILMSRSGYLNPFLDNGDYGVLELAYFIKVYSNVEGEYILKLLQSKLYKYITTTYKYSGFNSHIVLKRLKYPKLEVLTDQNIYRYFDLTQEEIDLIEKTIKD